MILPGQMPDRLPENAAPPADFTPVAEARRILRVTRAGTLGTLDRNTGHPFASLVNVATDVDGSPLILVSGLSTHTANLEIDGRASLLLATSGKGDPLAHPRLTVLGRFLRLDKAGPDHARARRRLLSRHPKSQIYVDFPDFSIWRLDVVSAHLNGGFARAADLGAADLLTDVVAAALVEAEADAIAHMNADHADAVALYAERLAKARPGAWRITGIDPDGLDLALGDHCARVAFPAPVVDPAQLRAVLKALADRARAAPESPPVA